MQPAEGHGKFRLVHFSNSVGLRVKLVDFLNLIEIDKALSNEDTIGIYFGKEGAKTRPWRSRAEELEATDTTLRVYTHLKEHGPTRALSIAKALSLDLSTVVKALKDLMKSGKVMVRR